MPSTRIRTSLCTGPRSPMGRPPAHPLLLRQRRTMLTLVCRFLEVANSSMCGPIRSLTEARGHNTSAHHLASFGGAGGQHACAIAESLGVKRVLIHKYSSILSAHGIGLADVVHEMEAPCAKAYNPTHIPSILSDLEALGNEAKTHPSIYHFGDVELERYLNMRYDGSDTAMMIALQDQGDAPDALETFVQRHHQQFGFTPVNRDVFVDTIRVRGIGRQPGPTKKKTPGPAIIPKPVDGSGKPSAVATKSVYFKSLGWAEVPVYMFAGIPAGQVVPGPSLVVDKTQTILIGPGSSAHIRDDVLVMDVSPPKQKTLSSTHIDPIALSVFRHRFMGVAEQMGQVLQKVSVSANIKERLDFSCAIFAPDGSLVANAPHVPAMIGSMAFAVKTQIQEWEGKLRDGDVLLSNSPGKSHPQVAHVRD